VKGLKGSYFFPLLITSYFRHLMKLFNFIIDWPPFCITSHTHLLLEFSSMQYMQIIELHVSDFVNPKFVVLFEFLQIKADIPKV
jgi:hypothetical protein